MPVSSATSERSFSAMRRVKNYLRSTMGDERLSNLSLMHIHRQIAITKNKVLDDFINSKNRRLDFAWHCTFIIWYIMWNTSTWLIWYKWCFDFKFLSVFPQIAAAKSSYSFTLFRPSVSYDLYLLFGLLGILVFHLNCVPEKFGNTYFFRSVCSFVCPSNPLCLLLR